MKQMSMFILLLVSTSIILCAEEKAQSLLEKSKNKQPSSELGKDLPEANSYWEGWVHYYHYTTDPVITKPNIFFQNNEFFSQRVPLALAKKTDQYGPMIIPNKSSFFAVLTQTAVQIYASRDDSFKKQVDYLLYEYIDAIPEDAFLTGGIKDMGNFKAGSCIEIKARLPNGKELNDLTNTEETTWIFCLDKDKDKQKMLKTILKLKLQLQRVKGVFKTQEALKTEAKNAAMADMMHAEANKIPDDDRAAGAVESPRDGYWLLLQNWTDCTLKCGGGQSFQQWQCVPPKNGGKPCQGKAIRERKCNTQPCPGVTTLLNTVKASEPEVKKPIVKVAPFSTRLQRYSKCQLKENDAFLAAYDEVQKVDTKIPVRVVMNNSTLTVYKDDFYQDVHYTYELAKTTFLLSKQFCCFEVKDSIKLTKLCGYEKNCGEVGKNQWATQWSSDFTLFKVECNVGKQTTLLSEEDEQQLKVDLKKKVAQARLDIIGNQQEQVRQQMMVNQNNGLKQEVVQTQNTGFKAIEKELQLESLIKNEEKAKEESEIQQLKAKIEAEKEKATCMHNSIKERDLDAEFLAEKRTAEQEVKEIKAEIAQQVELKRGKMKKMIQEMQAKARVRKSALENELNSLRQTMAKEMLQANKNGDIDKCSAGKTNLDKRETYCNENYLDDFVRNSDCKTDDNFCYMCCETEFGNMFIDRREACYNMCDLPAPEAVKPEVKAEQKGEGPWLWTPKAA